MAVATLEAPEATLIGPQEELVTPILETIVRTQTERLVGLGFHELLGLTEAQYRLSTTLPKGIAQLVDDNGIFDKPLIVDPRISLPACFARSNPPIYNPVPERVYSDLIETPKAPYLIWTSDPIPERTWYKAQRSPITLEQTYVLDAVESTFHEVASIWIHYPGFFLDERGIPSFALIAAGTRAAIAGGSVESDLLPDLRFFHRDAARVGAVHINNPVSGWRVSLRGKNVVLLGRQH